jgi:hypothetical protein
LQDEEERALALALLASTGEKKSRGDRRKERKERKEAVRQAALVSTLMMITRRTDVNRSNVLWGVPIGACCSVLLVAAKLIQSKQEHSRHLCFDAATL